MLNRLYPRRPWTADSLLLPPWKPDSAVPVAPVWQLSTDAGSIQPVEATARWSLEWTPTAPVHVTPHGVVEGPGDPTKSQFFCAFCPEPGVLIGEADPAHLPALNANGEGKVTETEDGEYLETPHHSVHLHRVQHKNRARFVLTILRDQADEDDKSVLERYASADSLALLLDALAPYQDFAQRQASLQPDDFAAVQASLFPLITGLRTSRDGTRVFGAPDEAGRFETKQIFPLIKAWSEVRVDIALALLRAVLEHQQPDGSVPIALDKLGAPVSGASHFPILAHCFHLIWAVRPERAWFDSIAPGIQRHLEFLVQSLDPERTGLPQWPPTGESLLSGLYETDTVSAELPALLAREITGLEGINSTITVGGLDLTDLLHYRDLLFTQLRESLWSAETGSFLEHFADGRPVMLPSIAGILPLLCRELTPQESSSLLNILLSRQHLLDTNGVRLQVPAASKKEPRMAEIALQLLLLEALETQNATTEATTLRSVLISNLPEIQSAEASALSISLLAVPAASKFNSRILSPALLWIVRHQRAILLTAAGFFILFNIVVFAYSCGNQKLTTQTIETTGGMARRYYQEGNYTAAGELLSSIIASKLPYPTAYLDMGNIKYHLGEWDEAERYYRQTSSTPAVQAQTLHNLAVLLLERGRTNEAVAAWEQVRADYTVTAPKVAERANTALELLGVKDGK